MKINGFCCNSIIAIGTLSLIYSATAVAQNTTPSGTSAREEIVVTARLREEDLQSVPLSITAFSEEDIARAGIRDLQDVANFTSNFTFENGPSARRNILTIRGLGAPDLATEDNNVGMFIDGVYVNAREGINMQMLDLERIEVVKGPQSALYGRSTFAGAVNYITRKPTEDFEFGTDITYGQHSLVQIDSFISGPLAGDKLLGRIAAAYEEDNGTYSNGAAGGGLGGFENYSLAGTLRWFPADDIDLTLNATYSDQDIGSTALGRFPNNCGINPSPTQDTIFYTCGEVPGAETSHDLALSPEAYSMRGDQLRITAHLDWDFDAFSLRSITAFSDLKQDSLVDLDRTQGGEDRWGHTFTTNFVGLGPTVPVDACFSCIPFEDNVIAFTGEIPQYFNENSTAGSKYWSQELQLKSRTDNSLRWMTGLFYYNSESDNQTGLTSDISQVIDELPANYADGTFIFFDPFVGGYFRSDFSPNGVFVNGATQNIVQLSTKKTSQWAVFGSLDYDFTNRLTASAEMRYTQEHRELIDRFDAFFGTGETLNESFGTRDNYIDPRFIINYSATDNAILYASAARGHRSGDCNPGDLPDELDPVKCYDAESNWTYEIGAKTNWLNDVMQLNIALFHVDWTDVQFRTQFPELGNLSTVTTNLGDLESQGLEVELSIAPTDGLLLSAAYGFSDPTFKDSQLDFGTGPLCSAGIFDGLGDNPCQVNPADGRSFVNIQGSQLRRTSKQTFNASVEYDRDLNADWGWYTRWDYRYQSKQFQEQHNAIWIGSRNIVNARLGLQSDNYDLSFWISNLTDDETPLAAYAFITDLNAADYVTTVVNSERRRWGITANIRF